MLLQGAPLPCEMCCIYVVAYRVGCAYPLARSPAPHRSTAKLLLLTYTYRFMSSSLEPPSARVTEGLSLTAVERQVISTVNININIPLLILSVSLMLSGEGGLT